MRTDVKGPKATNKFWANWIVEKGQDYRIYPMPYVLKWATAKGGGRELHLAHGSQTRSSGGRMQFYYTAWEPDLALGAREGTSDYKVVSEGLFGIHVELRGGAGQRLLFPIYSGMAYVSGKYSGGFTPKVSQAHGLAAVRKVQDGIWSFRNKRGATFRVYVLGSTSGFVDSSYDFDSYGNLNKQLDGWVRVAKVLSDGDVDVLDAHATAVVVGCRLELETGGTVRYAFQKEGQSGVKPLHYAYAHHVRMLSR